MKSRILKHGFTLAFLAGCSLSAQPYAEGGKTRHRFAQLNLGMDTRLFSGAGSESWLINASGSVERVELADQTDARLLIGGTHFWGHADFYIAIPVSSFTKSGFSTKVETGTRYLPWRIEHGKIRPYAGVAMLPVVFRQGAGVSQIRFRLPVTGGLMFNYRKHVFELGAGYIYNNRELYYLSPQVSAPVKAQSCWISLGYKFMIETTLGAERDWQSGRTKRLTDTLSALDRLNGFTIAIGPSVAFFPERSPHTESLAPYLDNHKATGAFPELGLGYYLHTPDVQLNFSYRSAGSRISAYGLSQTVTRKALAFEACKFIGDYHGFAPFIGPAISYERIYAKETNAAGLISEGKYEGIKYGITIGWDIRPDRLQVFYLRTNLRYFPNLNVKMENGRTISSDQIELNFIQLVIYPERILKR